MKFPIKRCKFNVITTCPHMTVSHQSNQKSQISSLGSNLGQINERLDVIEKSLD